MKKNKQNSVKKSSPFSPEFINYISLKSYITAATSLLLLGMLHWLSPEFNPSWSMVSEYAMGNYSFVAALMFAAMATSCIALCFALMSHTVGTVAKIGNFLLGAASVGLYLAAVFGLPHPLHGLSALIGIPSLTIAILILSVQLPRQKLWKNYKLPMLAIGNLTWISLVAMCIFVYIGMTQFAGNFALGAPVGLPNRVLMFCYGIWLMLVSWPLLKTKK